MAGSRHIRLEALIPGSVLAKTLPSDSSGSPGSGSDNTTGQQHYRNEAAAGLAISQLLGSSSTAEAIDQAQSNVFLRYSTLLAAATTDGASGGSSAGQWPSATSSAMRSSPEGSNSDGAGSSARQAPRSKGVLLTLWRGDAGAIRSDTGSTTDNTPPEHGSGDEVADCWFARFRRGALTGVGAAAGAASAGGGPASAGSHRIQEALNKTYLGAHSSRQQQGGCADSKIMPQGAAADEGTPSQVPWYWGAASNVGTAMLAVAVVVVCGAAVLAAAHQPEQQQHQQGRQSRHDRLL
jgi:hypothetical protein